MPNLKGSNGQDPEGQADEDEEDLEDSSSDESQDEDEEEDGEGAGSKPTGSDLSKLTPEQKDAEILRLREENARRRIATRKSRENEKKALDEAKKKQSDSEKMSTLEKENLKLTETISSLKVQSELRDYIAEKHPKYSKLAKRIAKFVDLDDVDLDDDDSIRDAVSQAVEDFVKEVPISAKDDEEDDRPNPTDRFGRPVGGLGGIPARRAAADTSAKSRREKLFPNIYSGPKA